LEKLYKIAMSAFGAESQSICLSWGISLSHPPFYLNYSFNTGHLPEASMPILALRTFAGFPLKDMEPVK